MPHAASPWFRFVCVCRPCCVPAFVCVCPGAVDWILPTGLQYIHMGLGGSNKTPERTGPFLHLLTALPPICLSPSVCVYSWANWDLIAVTRCKAQARAATREILLTASLSRRGLWVAEMSQLLSLKTEPVRTNFPLCRFNTRLHG